MTRKRLFPSSLLALLLALGLGVASCDQLANTGPESSDAPQPAYLLDSDEDGDGEEDGDESEETEREVEGTDGNTYLLVEDVLPTDLDDLSVSKLIDEDGGQISLAGHRLTVPDDAVEQPTLFTMTLATNGYLEVDLSATVTDLLGNVVEVGTEENPFQEPVTLTLRYNRSPNVDDDVEPDLINMRMIGDDHDDLHEPLESEVDEEQGTVSTELPHFTGYCMAY